MKRWIHAATTEDEKYVEEFKKLLEKRKEKYAGRVWTDEETWIAWKPRLGPGRPYLNSCDIDDYIADRNQYADPPAKLGIREYKDTLLGEGQAFRYAEKHGFLNEWLSIRFPNSSF